MDEKYQVFVHKVDFGEWTSVYFTKVVGGKRYVAKPVQLEYVEVDRGDAPEPTLALGEYESTPFLKAIVNECMEKGITPDVIEPLKNVLDATKYHLEDMRKLVFQARPTACAIDFKEILHND